MPLKKTFLRCARYSQFRAGCHRCIPPGAPDGAVHSPLGILFYAQFTPSRRMAARNTYLQRDDGYRTGQPQRDDGTAKASHHDSRDHPHGDLFYVHGSSACARDN